MPRCLIWLLSDLLDPDLSRSIDKGSAVNVISSVHLAIQFKVCFCRIGLHQKEKFILSFDQNPGYPVNCEIWTCTVPLGYKSRLLQEKVRFFAFLSTPWWSFASMCVRYLRHWSSVVISHIARIMSALTLVSMCCRLPGISPDKKEEDPSTPPARKEQRKKQPATLFLARNCAGHVTIVIFFTRALMIARPQRKSLIW